MLYYDSVVHVLFIIGSDILNGDYRCHGEENQIENIKQSHNMQNMQRLFDRCHYCHRMFAHILQELLGKTFGREAHLSNMSDSDTSISPPPVYKLRQNYARYRLQIGS